MDDFIKVGRSERRRRRLNQCMGQNKEDTVDVCIKFLAELISFDTSKQLYVETVQQAMKVAEKRITQQVLGSNSRCVERDCKCNNKKRGCSND